MPTVEVGQEVKKFFTRLHEFEKIFFFLPVARMPSGVTSKQSKEEEYLVMSVAPVAQPSLGVIGNIRFALSRTKKSL